MRKPVVNQAILTEDTKLHLSSSPKCIRRYIESLKQEITDWKAIVKRENIKFNEEEKKVRSQAREITLLHRRIHELESGFNPKPD
jgi:hypothetical protein